MEKTIYVFISQTMANKTDKQINDERVSAQEKLSTLYPNNTISIIDSYDPGLKDSDPVYALGYSIQQLSKADIVYFIRGWEAGRGCQVEHLVATMYGKKIVEE